MTIPEWCNTGAGAASIVGLAEATRMLQETNREMAARFRENRAAWAAEMEAWAELLRELRALRLRPEEDR
jgi:hypothetical protein